MTLSSQFLDELRTRTLLSALVGKSVKLVKAGREYRGCCPFHNEKTPSFYVNDDKGFYHCFGCSAHGDAIRWMTDQRGLPFMDAVKELAAVAGLEVPAADPRQAQKAERAKGLYEAMADAAAWFVQQLSGPAGSEARALLERRGITPQTARDFGLGFAPESRNRLRTALARYGDTLLVEAGLLISVDDKEPYDRFRGRLMIPIRDQRGRVIAFGGRVIGAGEPKYLNSPDTPLFDKGRTLYNLDRAAAALRRAGRVIVVEGYMDVIALAQAGIGEAVAPLGTALTEAQLERLWRLNDVPILCFDGDAAGQKAAVRAALKAMPMLDGTHSLAFVTPPQGYDPDDLIRAEGRKGFENLIARAVPLETFVWQAELLGMADSGPQQRTALQKRLQSHASGIKDPDTAREYRRTFNDLFFNRFGWKKKSVEQISRDMFAAFRQNKLGLEFAFHRAIFLGLMRYPSVLYEMLDEVSKLPVSSPYIDNWRVHLISIALREKDLNEDMVEQIMSTTDVHPLDKRNLSRDLAFSFYYRDRDDAPRDLKEAIHILIEEHDTRQAAKIVQEATMAAWRAGMGNADQLHKQQRAILDQQQARERLMAWLERISNAA